MNKIIMGCNVYQEFQRQFYYGYIEEKEILDCALTSKSKFYGIPVEVDYENLNRLEIGHMIKLS